ncbi:hypothetical protein G9464_05585 [Halostella sp. JP-L12]|uniref:hypothetical protein n=1 Tax=Halostella TaxID=1843185 RepID=UPI000EF82EB2|nr:MULTISPECIES: hypothetical protein [Halostella]NHN47069.1 hypothetical protein [Halostella sp. JP-L12]
MNVAEALRTGYERTASRTGLALVGVAFLVQVASAAALQSQPPEALALIREQYPELAPDPGGPLSLPLSAAGATALSLAATVATAAVFVVAFRALSDDGVPSPGTVTRNVGRATLHGFVGYLLLLALVGVGLALFVVPGVFALVTFAFFVGFVALEDEGVVGAYRRSWALTSGRRLGVALLLGALLLVVVLFTVVAGLPLSLVFEVSETLAYLGNVAVSALTFVYAAAVLAVGFEQLRNGDERDDEFADIDDELLP